jgi:hypothetical protein
MVGHGSLVIFRAFVSAKVVVLSPLILSTPVLVFSPLFSAGGEVDVSLNH